MTIHDPDCTCLFRFPHRPCCEFVPQNTTLPPVFLFCCSTVPFRCSTLHSSILQPKYFLLLTIFDVSANTLILTILWVRNAKPNCIQKLFGLLSIISVNHSPSYHKDHCNTEIMLPTILLSIDCILPLKL